MYGVHNDVIITIYIYIFCYIEAEFIEECVICVVDNILFIQNRNKNIKPVVTWQT